MGLTNLMGIIDSDLPFAEQVKWHLTSNCYPPVPVEFHPACLLAIKLVADGEAETEVSLPSGVFYRGKATAPAEAIVDNFRLYPFADSIAEGESSG
jgi:hypothetical protein